MPHSRSGKRPTRKNCCKKLEKYLNERLKHLRALSRKDTTNALHIKLPHVSLGELRTNYKPRHISVDPILLQDTPNFTIYQSGHSSSALRFRQRIYCRQISPKRFHVRPPVSNLCRHRCAPTNKTLPLKRDKAKHL